MTQILKPKMWREKNTQTQRHRNIDKQTKTHKFRFWALNVAWQIWQHKQ